MKQFKTIGVPLILGMFVGFANGFFGGGGGMIAVPAMVYIMGLEEKKAHASAMFVILPITISSAIVYVTQNPIDILDLVSIGGGVIVGGVIGALVLNKLPNKVLAVIFSIIMIVAGIKLVM